MDGRELSLQLYLTIVVILLVMEVNHHYSPHHPPKPFELNSTDKLYSLTIPDYELIDGVVFYCIQLKDLLTN